MGRTTGTTAADGARRAEIAVIGSGPGGAVTATRLAQAGRDVALIEDGEHLPLSSAPHFSREEILQKYRNGGINLAMGRAKVAYVEGRCVGGGSEINRGLYHRIAPETLDGWRRDYRVEALSADELRPHFDVCEQIARVSFLPGEAPQLSLRLQAGASALGWGCAEAPRLFSYAADWRTGAPGVKQSMTETFVPRFLAAGGRLVPQTRVRRLARHNGRWQLRALQDAGERGQREIEIVADTVVVACGAVQTPALLRRSGITHNVGDQLRWHPMVKVVACFTDPVNQLSELEPVHQVKEFEPRFSMGCSISKRPALALALVEHPGGLAEVARNWRHMAIYYVQSTGGSGTVHPLPGFRDPLVRARHVRADMADLADGLTKLCTCLFAAGAIAIYPGVSGLPVLRSEADLRQIPRELPAARANLTTLHLFSSCPMGEDQRRCAVDSFGRVHGADRLYVADASLLCGPTLVNPQGPVMAVAHRNAQQLLDGDWRRARARAAPAPGGGSGCGI